MADYQLNLTGTEIEEALKKVISINKTASQINASLSYLDNIIVAMNVAKIGEIMAKSASGSMTGTGIINSADKIFFPVDGRFPSSSVDIGPAITLSENGGFVQQISHTLDKKYLVAMYENSTTGTSKPQYWKREPQETNVVIQPVNSLILSVSTLEYVPTADSQLNAVYLDFVSSVSNLAIEIISKATGKPIKYIPNEKAWIDSIGGINVQPGINNVLPTTPISVLTSYDLQVNFSKPVQLRGNQSTPYIAVDRQLITRKDIMLNEEFDNVDRISAVRTTNLSLSSTPTVIAYDAVSSQKSIDNASGEIYFQNAGLYSVSVKSYIAPTATTEIWMYVEKKPAGSSTWSRIQNTGSKIKAYNEGLYTIIGSIPLQIAAGDKIRVQTAITNNGNATMSLQTATVGAETLNQYPSVLNIIRI